MYSLKIRKQTKKEQTWNLGKEIKERGAKEEAGEEEGSTEVEERQLELQEASLGKEEQVWRRGPHCPQGYRQPF